MLYSFTRMPVISETTLTNMPSATQQLMNLSSRESPSLKYSKGPLLGQGGFACVYGGIRKSDGVKVAMKHMQLKPDEQRNQLILNEITNLKKFSSHQHILTFIDCHVYQSNVWLLTEYVDGLTALELAHKAPIPPVYMASICHSVLKAVHHLHDNGVVHCDIKIDNIMVSKTGHAKLIDMGLSSKALTMTNYRSGHPFYLAPELFKSPPYQLDCPIDIWALGICIFCLLYTSPSPRD